MVFFLGETGILEENPFFPKKRETTDVSPMKDKQDEGLLR